jgi:hypothetical protein
MQPPSPRPVRVIIEIDPGQAAALVTQLLDRVLARVPPAPGPTPTEPVPPAQDDVPAQPLERTTGPPLDHGPALAPGSTRGQVRTPTTPLVPRAQWAVPRVDTRQAPRPVLPPSLTRVFTLAAPCSRGHTYLDTPYGLRRRSNRSCVQCERERKRTTRKTTRRRRVRAREGAHLHATNSAPHPTGTSPGTLLSVAHRVCPCPASLPGYALYAPVPRYRAVCAVCDGGRGAGAGSGDIGPTPAAGAEGRRGVLKEGPEHFRVPPRRLKCEGHGPRATPPPLPSHRCKNPSWSTGSWG